MHEPNGTDSSPRDTGPFEQLDDQFVLEPDPSAARTPPPPAADDSDRTLADPEGEATLMEGDSPLGRTRVDPEGGATLVDSRIAPTRVVPPPSLGVPTLRQSPMRSPPAAPPTRTWLLATAWFALPAAVGAFFLLSSPPDREGNLHFHWLAAAATAPDGAVVVRPRADGHPPEAALTLRRQDDRLIASRGARKAWAFPTHREIALPGESLDDAVLWVPARTTTAVPWPDDRDPVLLVLWREPGERTPRTRLSLLDRAGVELWTAVLDGRATPERLAWLESEQALLYVPAEAPPVRYSLLTGERLAAPPSEVR